jgi:Flp pilus assembly protein TadD
MRFMTRPSLKAAASARQPASVFGRSIALEKRGGRRKLMNMQRAIFAAAVALFIFASCGLTLYGQYPGSTEDGDWRLPGMQSSPATPHSTLTSLHSDDFAFLSADQRATADRPEGNDTITVAELQHPLSGKTRSLLLKAQTAMRRGNFDECFQDLDKAIKINSAVPYVHSVRGAAYLLQGHVPEAVLELQQAVQVLPIPANYTNLAYAYLLSGDVELGEQELRRAIRFHSPLPQVRYLIGLLLLDRKPQVKEACENLQRARDLMPAVHMALAVCYVRDGQEVAANEQIRQVLGPANGSEFEFWRNWVGSVAARPRPSTAFGLYVQPTAKAQ